MRYALSLEKIYDHFKRLLRGRRILPVVKQFNQYRIRTVTLMHHLNIESMGHANANS